MNSKINKNISTKVEPVNDFDLQPEKKRAALSTIKNRLKEVDFLLKNINKLYSADIIQNFDRLKIWIDLNKYGKDINFSIGKNLIKYPYPSLSPYQRRTVRHKNQPTNQDTDDEFDEEIISYDGRKKIYPDCGIRYDVFIKSIGINNVYIQNDILIIDITGKLMAEYGTLGLININNIDECLIKLQRLNLFSFNTDKFMKYAGCYIVDVTLDIFFSDKNKLKKCMTALGSFAPIISNNFYINKYKKGGLLIKKKTKDTGSSLIAYHKGEEIITKPAPSKETKPVKYREIIGEEGMYIADHTYRIEIHIYKIQSIRKSFKIPAKTKGLVKLKDVLASKTPVIFNMILESGIDLNELYNSLKWYEFKSSIFENNVPMSEEDFKELIMAEWVADLLKRNDFDIDILKKHLLTEYNYRFDKCSEKSIISFIQKNLFNFMCFKKPKTVAMVLILINFIQEQYIYDAKINKKNSKIKKSVPKYLLIEQYIKHHVKQ